MIRLTDRDGGHSLYLNPAAIESIGRPGDLTADLVAGRDASGAVIRMMTSAVHTVSEKPEAIVALLDGARRNWPESEPRWRIPYEPR
jgi:hypothetical protein